MRHLLAALSLALIALTAACGNQCDFTTRCQGNTLQTCGQPDQMVNRQISSNPCSSPNPVCVQLVNGGGFTEAICAQSDTACSVGAPSCTGDTVVTCNDRFKRPVAAACGSQHCAPVDGGAACR
jgi:hypothetical protein